MFGGKTCCLLALACLVVVVVGEHVGVTMCCPEGMVLKIMKNKGKRLGGWWQDVRGDEYVPKCMRSRKVSNDTHDLEGSLVTVVDTNVDGHNGEKVDRKTGLKAGEKSMILKKTGVKLPSCF